MVQVGAYKVELVNDLHAKGKAHKTGKGAEWLIAPGGMMG